MTGEGSESIDAPKFQNIYKTGLTADLRLAMATIYTIHAEIWTSAIIHTYYAIVES